MKLLQLWSESPAQCRQHRTHTHTADNLIWKTTFGHDICCSLIFGLIVPWIHSPRLCHQDKPKPWLASGAYRSGFSSIIFIWAHSKVKVHPSIFHALGWKTFACCWREIRFPGYSRPQFIDFVIIQWGKSGHKASWSSCTSEPNLPKGLK